MVKMFHCRLKTALTARGSRYFWTSYLPHLSLGTGFTFKSDLKCTLAELVYETTLRVSRHYLAVPPDKVSPPYDCVHGLREFFNQFRPAFLQTVTTRNIFVSND